MSQTRPEDQPSNVLRAEHEVILRVVDVLDRLMHRYFDGAGFEVEALQRCVEFFRHFADACHHAKEEDHLFPALESRGIPRENGPIGCMLAEHDMARTLTKKMGEALEARQGGDSAAEEQFQQAASQYIELLRNHIGKENNVLFPMGDQALTEADQQSLCGRFGEVACRSFGGKNREVLAKMADELEAQWPA